MPIGQMAVHSDSLAFFDFRGARMARGNFVVAKNCDPEAHIEFEFVLNKLKEIKSRIRHRMLL